MQAAAPTLGVRLLSARARSDPRSRAPGPCWVSFTLGRLSAEVQGLCETSSEGFEWDADCPVECLYLWLVLPSYLWLAYATDKLVFFLFLPKFLIWEMLCFAP